MQFFSAKINLIYRIRYTCKLLLLLLQSAIEKYIFRKIIKYLIYLLLTYFANRYRPSPFKTVFACNDLSLNSNLTHPYSDLFNDSSLNKSTLFLISLHLLNSRVATYFLTFMLFFILMVIRF